MVDCGSSTLLPPFGGLCKLRMSSLNLTFGPRETKCAREYRTAASFVAEFVEPLAAIEGGHEYDRIPATRSSERRAR